MGLFAISAATKAGSFSELSHRRGNQSGRDGIHADAFARVVERSRLGQTYHAMLGSNVG